MTWLKLSDDFGDECANAGLSDAAFRTHVEGLLWTMRRETDGALTFRDVKRFAESEDYEVAVKELVEIGFWDSAKSGYQVVHAMPDQVEAEVMARRREANADRQRRLRRKKVGLAEEDPPDVSRRDKQCDKTRDPGLVGAGLDGTGKPLKDPRRKGEEHVDTSEGGFGPSETDESWPEVATPGANWADSLYENE